MPTWTFDFSATDKYDNHPVFCQVGGRTITFVADTPGTPEPIPPSLWPGEAHGTDDLTLAHGFPMASARRPVLPTIRNGKLVELRLDVRAAARHFARAYLIRYLGRGNGRHLFSQGSLRKILDELGDFYGEVSDWAEISEERVRGLIEGYLAGFEDGYRAAGSLLAQQPDRISMLLNELPRLPWGSSGDAGAEHPHLDFVGRVLTVDPSSNVTTDELWEVFRTLNNLGDNVDWGRESVLRGELRIAVDMVFSHERGVKFSNGNIKRVIRSAAGEFIGTRRHKGWIGLALSVRR